MNDTLEIPVIKEIDFDDFEEVIAKDYKHCVKLKSCDEPYEVTKDTYERVLAWIAEMNAKRKEPKRCPFCGAEALIVKSMRVYYIWCSDSDCLMWANAQICWHATKEGAIAAWNRRVR